MNAYFISVAAAALICSLCEALTPEEGGLRKTLSIASAVLLIITLMSPVRDIAVSLGSIFDGVDEDVTAGTVSEEYRTALASQTAAAAAVYAEDKFSVPAKSMRITVTIPDGASIPDKVTVRLTGDGMWASSTALEEYLTDKLGVKCAVIKEEAS